MLEEVPSRLPLGTGNPWGLGMGGGHGWSYGNGGGYGHGHSDDHPRGAGGDHRWPPDGAGDGSSAWSHHEGCCGDGVGQRLGHGTRLEEEEPDGNGHGHGDGQGHAHDAAEAWATARALALQGDARRLPTGLVPLLGTPQADAVALDLALERGLRTLAAWLEREPARRRPGRIF